MISPDTFSLGAFLGGFSSIYRVAIFFFKRLMLLDLFSLNDFNYILDCFMCNEKITR